MLLSTESMNKVMYDNAHRRLTEYFSCLPITDIVIHSEDIIYDVLEYRETVGFFIKKQIDVREVVPSYRVSFTFNDTNKEIYLNEDILKDKESLIHMMRFDLGIR